MKLFLLLVVIGLLIVVYQQQQSIGMAKMELIQAQQKITALETKRTPRPAPVSSLQAPLPRSEQRPANPVPLGHTALDLKPEGSGRRPR